MGRIDIFAAPCMILVDQAHRDIEKHLKSNFAGRRVALQQNFAKYAMSDWAVHCSPVPVENITEIGSVLPTPAPDGQGRGKQLGRFRRANRL